MKWRCNAVYFAVIRLTFPVSLVYNLLLCFVFVVVQLALLPSTGIYYLQQPCNRPFNVNISIKSALKQFKAEAPDTLMLCTLPIKLLYYGNSGQPSLCVLMYSIFFFFCWEPSHKIFCMQHNQDSKMRHI